MCLGIPVRVMEVDGQSAVVDVGGARREISLLLLDDVIAGDWVILHAGFAIQKLDEEEAEKTLALLRELPGAAEIH
ncbi:MAG: HypC/HybG/HupF family hydrogenase formation chaperone [Deltaproteobacteria bacterium]